jgi:PAS domain S-box-containing protein
MSAPAGVTPLPELMPMNPSLPGVAPVIDPALGEDGPHAGSPRPGSAMPGIEPTSGHAVQVTRRQRRALLAAASGFLLLALACLFAGYLAWRTVRFNEQITAAADLRRAAFAVRETLLEVESAQRLYLLTGDAADLAALRTGLQALPDRLATLGDTAPPAWHEQAVAMQRAGETALADLARLPPPGSTAAALAAIFDSAVRGTLGAAHGAARTLVADTTGQMTGLASRQRRLGTQVVLWIVLSLLGAAALAVALLRDTRRHVRQLAGRELRLHQLSATLDQRVAQRTRALTEANLRLEVALSATGVTVAIQDRALRFTWISKGEYGHTADEMTGRTDEEINPDPTMATVAALKRGVIDTGEPARRELRVVHDGTESWIDLSVQPLLDDSGAIGGIIAAAINVTPYKEQETRIRLLMREVTHRSLNLLAVIEAIMRQTASNATTVADFEARFSSRLQSLAGSHDLLVQEDWSGASLRALVRSQLGHFADVADSQVEITGPPLHLQPDAAQHIGMALHELAANAARYGALSVPGGKVVVAWRMVTRDDGEEACELTWHELGGPPVVPPTRRGFGRIVIERTVARGVQGEVRADYLRDGLQWTLTFPASLTVRS